MKVGLVAFVVLCATGRAGAHGLEPSSLTLREVTPGTFEVTWQTATQKLPGTNVQPRLPARCRREGNVQVTPQGEHVSLSWTVACGPGDLAGETLAVDDLGAAKINALLRVIARDGTETLAVLSPGHPSFTLPMRPDGWTVVRDYVGLGVEHILEGLDHLAFVLGLVLLVPTTRRLAATITAFTAGHSVTLSLAALGLAVIPQAPIEVVIAASVLLLAVELAQAPGHAGRIARVPWLMAAGFGLLHGLGFAGALAEAGLPVDHALTALLAFNVGIEIGQLAFVAAVLAVLAVATRLLPAFASLARRPVVYAMGIVSASWCFERLATLLR